MRLLYITYKVDEQDSLVGFAVGWINALAVRLDQLYVICLATGQAELASNVTVSSLGKERGVGRCGRLLNFYRAAWAHRQAVDAVFCQFSPLYVILIAPLAKLYGWPIILWYTHRHVSLELRLAVALVDRVVTASVESFQLASGKTRVIGHGIDTDRFCPGDSPLPNGAERTVLAVGRIAPIKNYETLIDAAHILIHEYGRQDLRFLVVGGVEGPVPAGYAEQLKQRVAELGLEGKFHFVGQVPHSKIVDYYRRAAVAVNLCPTGGLDKAVLEGMAVGVPTLVRNVSFAPILGDYAERLVVPDGGASAVSQKLEVLLDLSDLGRQSPGVHLREIVVHGFSQQVLIERLAASLLELVGGHAAGIE